MAGLKPSASLQWHLTQFSDGKLKDHKIYPSYESGRIALEFQQKRAQGSIVLCRPSHCECRGRD